MPLLTLAVMFVGLGLTVITATTAMVPFTARLFVQNTFVPGNVGSVTVLNAPLVGVLNRVNVSPAARLVEPMFTTVIVAPEFAVTPGATNSSLFGKTSRLIFIVTAPEMEAALLAVSVPMVLVNAPRAAMPGARFPPASTLTVPPMLPLPPNVALVLTLMAEEPVAPLTAASGGNGRGAGVSVGGGQHDDADIRAVVHIGSAKLEIAAAANGSGHKKCFGCSG